MIVIVDYGESLCVLMPSVFFTTELVGLGSVVKTSDA